MVSKNESNRRFRTESGLVLTNYHFSGKDMQLEEICQDPQGNWFLKHDYVTENFRHTCRNCGHEHGLKNTEEEMKSYKVNTIFHQ